MAGHAEDRHPRLMVRVQRRGLGRLDLAAAEQVQQVVGVAGAAEPLLDVGHRRRRGRTAGRRCAPGGTAARPARAAGTCAAASGRCCPASSAAGCRGLVGRGALEQVVVHLHHDPRAGLAAGRRSRRGPGSRRRRAPRRPASWRRRRWRTRPRGRCRRSRSSPRPAARASFASASATCSGATRNRITWCTTSGLPGSTLAAGQPDVLVQLRVEQEAAVVVGADAGRRGRRVLRRHRQRHPLLAVAQRELLARRRSRRAAGPRPRAASDRSSSDAGVSRRAGPRRRCPARTPRRGGRARPRPPPAQDARTCDRFIRGARSSGARRAGAGGCGRRSGRRRRRC